MSFTVIKTTGPLTEQARTLLHSVSDDWITVTGIDYFYTFVYSKLTERQLTYLTLLLGGNINT